MSTIYNVSSKIGGAYIQDIRDFTDFERAKASIPPEFSVMKQESTENEDEYVILEYTANGEELRTKAPTNFHYFTKPAQS